MEESTRKPQARLETSLLPNRRAAIAIHAWPFHPPSASKADTLPNPLRRWKRSLLTAALFSGAILLCLPHKTTISPPSRNLKRRTTACQSSLWHVSTDPTQFDTCTNSPSYPSNWNSPKNKDTMLFMCVVRP
jgi:hypothetical protein